MQREYVVEIDVGNTQRSKAVTTFPPFTPSCAYLGLSFPHPYSLPPRFASHDILFPLSRFASLSLADVASLHRYLGL